MNIPEAIGWTKLVLITVSSVMLAVAVLHDATQRRRELHLGIQPWVWCLIVLSTNAVGLVVYWLMNRCKWVQDNTL